jgi:hypothetical protein
LNNSTSIEEFKKKLEEVDISNFIEIKNIVWYVDKYFEIEDTIIAKEKLLNNYIWKTKQEKNKIIELWNNKKGILWSLKISFDKYWIDDNSEEYKKLEDIILQVNDLIMFF